MVSKLRIIAEVLAGNYTEEHYVLKDPKLEIDAIEARLQADLGLLQAALDESNKKEVEALNWLNSVRDHREAHKARLAKVKSILDAVKA